MNQPQLPIEMPQFEEPRARPVARPEDLRVLRPVRNQAEIVMRDLDSLIADDHAVRALWSFLEGLDLADFYRSIKTGFDRPGRPPADPRVLLALWVYATMEGVGSARCLDRLCKEHDAYRWLCGGVSVDYHLLSDFRVAHGEALDRLLTQIVAVLMHKELVPLKRVAHDGMRVRASAGASSFRRCGSLEACLAEAGQRVKRLAEEREHPDPGVSRRRQAARERGAREREDRVKEALRELPRVQAAKARQQRKLNKRRREKIAEARVSTTDAEARVMKMPDGGWRPAYNVELATDVTSGVIVGAAVVNNGTDCGEAVPMEATVAERCGKHPEEYLVDGGFAQRATIDELTERKVTVYAPVPPPRTTTSGRTRWDPTRDDSAAMVAWRQRMHTEEAKETYKLRAATAEWANAQVRRHGLSSFTVRGLGKVTAVVLLVAVVHNILRALALAA